VRLTDIEIEVMNVFWSNGAPMTASDIISASPKRTWKETSIHVILKTLQEKETVVIDHYVPTAGRAAKAYKATMTMAQYLASQVLEFDVALPELFKAITESKKYLRRLPD